MNSGHWFETLRAILELLYFVAGIVIAGAAIWGLQQIRLTKQIAIKNAKREDLKFAAERCQYYAEKCVELETKALSEGRQLGLSLFTTPVQFEIEEGEIVKHNVNLQVAGQQVSRMSISLVAYLNSLEAFAIPFVAGVSDEELGFQETAPAFCSGIRQSIAALVVLRTSGYRYESCIKLYECWSKRLKVEDIKKKMKELEKQSKATDTPKIKPIGGV
jgi:hypothetical protein